MLYLTREEFRTAKDRDKNDPPIRLDLNPHQEARRFCGTQGTSDIALLPRALNRYRRARRG